MGSKRDGLEADSKRVGAKCALLKANPLELAGVKELILLTGFQRADHPSVPSPWDVARVLHGKVIEGYPIVSVMLPQSIHAAIKAMAELLEVYAPRYSLCLGPFADGESAQVPQAAVNVAPTLPLKDCESQVLGAHIVSSGTSVYTTRMPVDSICRSLRFSQVAADAPMIATEGFSNAVLFGMLHYLNTVPELFGTEGGLIQLPISPRPVPIQGGFGRQMQMDCWVEAVTQALVTTAVRHAPAAVA